MAHITPSDKLQITDADFDTIKENLKTFLQSQSEFTDYDFDGSGMQVFLNTLSYNTHYIAFYANLLANESFIDSAVVRDSVVSIAKHLNYTPSSATSPTATIDIDFTAVSGSPPSVTIQKNTVFNTTIDGTTYKFVTLESVVVPEDTGSYVATAVPIREGSLLNFDFTVNLSDTTQRFIIPNKNVDLSTLKVTIQNSATDTFTELWTKATTVTNIMGTDKVYWIQEIEDTKYELNFGNDIIGKALKDGNIIKIEYLVTNGPDANNANVFTANGTVAGETIFTITTNTSAFGGTDIESIESIKFLAPKLFSGQGRSVTEKDYKNTLLDLRTDIESITAWGGETEIPPQFGRVFIAAKPFGQLTFSDFDKEAMKSSLNDVNIVSVIPVFVDPEFTYINITTEVFYDDLTLSDTEDQLKTQVTNEIVEYFTDNLNVFEQPFRYSLLTKKIDDSNVSILNNDTSIKMEKRFQPTLNVTQTFILEFNNAITEGSLTSSQHGVEGFSDVFMDDLDGIIRCYRLVGNTKVILEQTAGTIDYTTGKVIITNIAFESVAPSDGIVKIIVTPSNNNLEAVREQIFTNNGLDITLTKDLK